MTPLSEEIKNLIRLEGPISLERYMTIALSDPRYGYYMTRDPFGAKGDFTTSPEISQIFGELLGLWCADLWICFRFMCWVHLIIRHGNSVGCQ